MEILGQAADWLSWACLAAGSLVVVTTGVALIRLPSYFSRVHGAGLSDTLGTGLILAGLALQVLPSGRPADLLVVGKLALLMAFTVLTSPVAAHALAKAAYLHGHQPEPEKDPLGAGAATTDGAPPSPP